LNVFDGRPLLADHCPTPVGRTRSTEPVAF